jgi:RNA-directed DNA polymerase
VRIWTPKAAADLNRGDAAVVSLALLHAEDAIARGLPPVLTLGHLAASAGVDYFFARNVVRRTERLALYTTFHIRKRSGGTREIAIPAYGLLLLQRWIHESILARIPVHGAAHAFCAGRGIRTMAAVHCGCRFLIKMDLQNFFGSLSESRVFRFFAHLGYSPLVAFEMARTCTYVPELTRQNRLRGRFDVDATTLPYPPLPLGVLPQGAPTSPALSNHLVHDLDSCLFKLAASIGLAYSRYSDDMAFSTRDNGPRHADTNHFIREVGNIVAAQGLTVNHRKTAVQRAGSRRLVTGLLVDGPEPRLTRKFRNALDLHLHYSEQFGLATHAKNRGFDTAFGLLVSFRQAGVTASAAAE